MPTTQLISACALALSIAGFAWNVQSWRYSGARIKVRALLAGTTLRLTITNAGRTPDAVTHVFLGGRLAGQCLDLSSRLPLPLKIEAAGPAEFDVDLTDAEDALLRRSRLGFESVHVCLGSLRTVRSDLIPHGRLHPAASWRMLRRPGVWRRFAPLSAALLAMAADISPSANAETVRTGLLLLALVGGGALYTTQFRRQRFFRARLERWLTGAGLLAAFALAGSGPSVSSSDAPPGQVTVMVLLAAGALSAVPGAIAAVLVEAKHVVSLLRLLRRSVVRLASER